MLYALHSTIEGQRGLTVSFVSSKELNINSLVCKPNSKFSKTGEAESFRLPPAPHPCGHPRLPCRHS
jgi:hypothetical protein